MENLTRLKAAFNLKLPDRPPILGGWLASPRHIQVLTGCSEEDYWNDPFYWGAQAERVLGSDGAIDVFTPVSRGEYRIVDGRILERQRAATVDSLLSWIDAQPGPDDLEFCYD